MGRDIVVRAPVTQTVTISSGSTESNVLDIRWAEFFGLVTSTALSSTTLTFRVGASSSSDASFYDLYEGSTQVTLVVSTAAARAYAPDTDRAIIAPWKWMKVLSGSTGEAAARAMTLFTV